MKKSLLLTFLIIVILIIPNVVKATEIIPQVQYLIDEGYVSGRLEGSTYDYALDEPIKRSEVTKLLLLTKGWTTTDIEGLKVKESIFSDVPSNHWALNYIALAADIGIITGDDAGHFNPEAHVTFAELCAMLVRGDLRWKKIDEESISWPDTFIDVADEFNILVGVKNFSPNDDLDRKTAFKMVYNHLMYKYVSG